MIQIDRLTKTYGRARGVTDLTLRVPEGSCFGFIGPNGAGKSTTIRTLLGLLPPTSGSAKVLGLDCVRKREKILAQVGYMPSEAMFYPDMRVGQVIRLSADLRKMDCRAEAAALCETLELDARKRIRELSLGNRKKVSIAGAMQHRPRLYVLDEPTSGPSGGRWWPGGRRGPRCSCPPMCCTRCSGTATGRPSSGRGGWWWRAPPRSWILRTGSLTTTRGGGTMTIFRKELSGGAVSFLVWFAVVDALMAVCVGMYPSMAGSMEDMSALFAGMGDFSAAFGLDKLQFGSIMGFYGTECNILGLGGAFYAALTAMGLLAGEEGGHTAEFLLTHPVSRLRVAAEKLLALAVLIAALNVVCFACGAGGILVIGETADWSGLLRYHGALLLMQLEVGGVCFSLSALLRRGGLGMGIAALLYFAGLLINLDSGLDWLRFVTPYYYADATRIFDGEALAGPVLTGYALGALGAVFGLWWYRRKDIA